MVYSQKLVACVKVDGKVLRESGDTVSIPFGSEYSILLKNLNSVRVQVKISIDGKDATEGTWLVIQPNSSIEVERFIRNGNLNKGNRFKFIEMTGAIEKHRGIQSDDGLVRIEWQVEKQVPISIPVPVPVYHHYYYPVYHRWPHWYDVVWENTHYVYGNVNTTPSGSGVFTSGLTSPTFGSALCNNAQITNTSNSISGAPGVNSAFLGSIARSANKPTKGQSRSLRATMSARKEGKSLKQSLRALDIQEQANDAGITVAGGESSQQFNWAAPFQVHDQKEVIVLKLRGVVAGKKVIKAVTVKAKPVCETCGKTNRATSKYCGQCGTALELI